MGTTHDQAVLDKCRTGMPVSGTYDSLAAAAQAGETLLDDGMLTIRATQDRDRYHVVVEHHAEAEDALQGCRIVLTDDLGHSGSIGHMAVFGPGRMAILCFHAGGRFKREVEAAAKTRRKGTPISEPISIAHFELFLLLLAPGESALDYVAEIRPVSDAYRARHA